VESNLWRMWGSKVDDVVCMWGQEDHNRSL